LTEQITQVKINYNLLYFYHTAVYKPVIQLNFKTDINLKEYRMKKNIIRILIPFIMILLIPPASLHAADLSVGATAWYTAWDYEDDNDSPITYDPAFLYGPVLSLAMSPDLSLSFVFLYGQFQMNFENGDPPMDLNRYDSDLTLNYRISSYFKLFAGAKYMGFTWAANGKHAALGPGAGISAVFPLGNDFFLLGYISGMYLMGNEDGDKSRQYKAETTEYGGNASLSLAYYIPGASTTLSLGGRYQQLKITYDDDNDGMTPDSMSKFYGVTVTAVYTFNIE
jgi:hypothetical protein